MENKLAAVFIDRDGTIGGDGHFIHPKNFKPYPFSKQALAKLDAHGVRRFAFTNQHRISRGQASVEDFQQEFSSYGFEEALICSHNKMEERSCRKPKPGMLQEAARKFQFDLKKCAVIGDVGATDMLAADEVGAIKVLVLTGWGKKSLDAYRNTWQATEADFVAENLLEAVEWLLD
ncbi:HAD-IIIA family hydrolase [Lentibacillus sediminis]|uniref:HAD-IIIA family hydrolase n=1 Tax=Lentibacillus sediminis TaxID=1940529 RepID=UPI000C1C3342|nr:HAD-IIIA family hydrolase [Lentibacillus sediminis]